MTKQEFCGELLNQVPKILRTEAERLDSCEAKELAESVARKLQASDKIADRFHDWIEEIIDEFPGVLT